MTLETSERDDGGDEEPFGYEPEYVFAVVKKMLERQIPGIDKTAATLYWSLREVLKARLELKDSLEKSSQDPEGQHEIGFDVGGDHWQFIANKDHRVGDFRLAHLKRGEVDEEAMIFIGREADNRFAYWNKRFTVPSGAKIFRGPNDPAARKIQDMIAQITPNP